jgi:hypothetical protein
MSIELLASKHAFLEFVHAEVAKRKPGDCRQGEQIDRRTKERIPDLLSLYVKPTKAHLPSSGDEALLEVDLPIDAGVNLVEKAYCSLGEPGVEAMIPTGVHGELGASAGSDVADL